MGRQTAVRSRYAGSMPDPGGWVILHEPRVEFDGDIRVLDIAGWRGVCARIPSPQRSS